MTLPICLSVGMLENDNFFEIKTRLETKLVCLWETVSNLMTNLKESYETASLSVSGNT